MNLSWVQEKSVPATSATPLSIVLTELLQNAIDHGFPEGEGGGTVAVALARVDDDLVITVVDDGVGVPDGFDVDRATGLGLSIVRTLVTTELAGEIEMRVASGAELSENSLTLRPGYRGTTVRLTVPLTED